MTEVRACEADTAEVPEASEGHSKKFVRIETRLSQAEAQIIALQDRVAELHAAARAAKQRGLWLRVFVLLAAFGAFFFIRSMKGGG